MINKGLSIKEKGLKNFLNLNSQGSIKKEVEKKSHKPRGVFVFDPDFIDFPHLARSVT